MSCEWTPDTKAFLGASGHLWSFVYKLSAKLSLKLSPCWMIPGNTMIVIDKLFTESSFPWLRYLQGTLRCLLSCSPWAQYSLCIFENYHRIITEYGTTRVWNCLFVETLVLMPSKSDNFVDFAVVRGVFKGITRFLMNILQFHENYHRESVW